MAAKTTEKMTDTTITNKVIEKAPVAPAAKVFVNIPAMMEGDTGNVDQNEYVTVNGQTTKIPRGEYVEVTVPVFLQLRNRYPNL